jgi:hypothetical protein
MPSSVVDPRGPRFAAALTATVLALVLVTGSIWLLVAQTAVFALGAAGRSPYTWLFRTVLRPRLGPPADLEDARPVRFAQTVGLAFGIVALGGVAVGATLVTLAATAAALAAAFLNAAFAVCLGCEAYLLLARARSHGRRGTTHPSDTRTEVSA